VTGDAGALPLPDAAFDATVSAFGVIFAPDPARALAEMMRVTRLGGVIALTSWAAEGAIFEAGRALCEALPAGEGDGPPPRWEDAASVAEAFGRAGAREVRIETARIASRPPRRAPGSTGRWPTTPPGAGAGAPSARRPGHR
jgi:SAM-dependent methyltransferase